MTTDKKDEPKTTDKGESPGARDESRKADKDVRKDMPRVRSPFGRMGKVSYRQYH